MNLVRLQASAVFHLTVLAAKICTKNGMSSSNATRAVGKRSAIVRLYERVHTDWRKIATAAAAVLAVAMGYHVVFGQNGLTVYQQKRQDAQMLQSQLRSLQRENELLKGHVERLQSDPNAIEHQAREELHYTRPGEVIYTLPATPSTKDTTSQSAAKH
jgi:cell division protein FtsB